MGALLGISLWVALATVVPGLVTLAVLFLCLAPAHVSLPIPPSDWVVAGLAVMVMVLTQTLGILLEELLVRYRLLSPSQISAWVPDQVNAERFVEKRLAPYEIYKGLYVLLAQMGEKDDAQGHLKRALAQFFLTINTLISFAIGVLLSLVLIVFGHIVLIYHAVGFLLAFAASFAVARIRFRDMVRSLWAVQSYRTDTGREIDGDRSAR